MPTDVLFCHDDDATCDFGAAGDGACTFHVALCLNVAEYRPSARGIRGACQPSDVAWVAFKSPREVDPRDATEVANRDQLEAVVAGVGAVVRRQCEPPAATGTACTADADCTRPRRCRSRFLLFEPPLQTIGACTAFANVVVPLPAGRPGAPGRTTLRVSVAAATDPRERDSDVLKLVCLGHAAPP